MKLPQEIKGRHRIRDLKICQLYIDGLIPREIAENFRKRNKIITERRIAQIVYENKSFINPRIGWDKTKRLHRLQRIANKQPDLLSPSKDILTVLEQIRKEIEGDKPLVSIDQSVRTVTYVWDDGSGQDKDTFQAPRISVGEFESSGEI